jgi:hypothetical protein
MRPRKCRIRISVITAEHKFGFSISGKAGSFLEDRAEDVAG